MKNQTSQKSITKYGLSQSKIQQPHNKDHYIQLLAGEKTIKEIYPRNKTPIHATNIPNLITYHYSPRMMPNSQIAKFIPPLKQRETFSSNDIQKIKMMNDQSKSNHNKSTKSKIPDDRKSKKSKLNTNRNNHPYQIDESGMNSPKFRQNGEQLKSKINDLQNRLKTIRKQYNLKSNAQQNDHIMHKNINKQSKQKNNQINQKTMVIKNKTYNQLFIPKANYISQNKQLQSDHKTKHNQNITEYKLRIKDQNIQYNQQNKNPNCLPKNQKYQNTTNLQKKKYQSELEQYVTQYKQQSGINNIKLTQCLSQYNIFKNKTRSIQNKYNQYYISSIIQAFSIDFNKNKHLTTFHQLCQNHLTSSIEILKHIKNSNLLEKVKSSTPTPTKLPPPTKPQTIVLDLDETLIHCNQSTKIPYDIQISVKFPNSTIKAGINIRPYAQQCLKQLSKYYEIIIYTASHQAYANVVIDCLDPNHQYISHRYFRESCFKTSQGFYMKDLRVIDRQLKNMLLVDNAAYSYGIQPQNGVPIIPFYDNKADTQLRHLIKYLKDFVGDKDMRTKNDKIMGITKYSQYSDPKMLINQLYL